MADEEFFDGHMCARTRAAGVKHQLHFAILEYLNKLGNEETDENSKEGLQVATEVLERVFGLNVKDTSFQKHFSSAPIELNDAFEVGRRSLSGCQDCCQKGYPASEDPLCETLTQYVTKLEEDGYFKEAKMHSPEWIVLWNEAKTDYVKKANEESENNFPEAEKLKQLGNESLKKGDSEGAYSLYSQAIELSPRHAVFYANRGTASIHMKKYKDALHDCQIATSLNNKYAKAYSNIGFCHFALDQFYEAKEYGYQPALALDPQNERVRESLHQCEIRLQEKAASCCKGKDSECVNKKGQCSPLQQAAAAAASGNQQMGNPFERLMDPSFISRLESDPELKKFKQNPKVQQMMEEVKNEGIGSVFKWLGDPEISEIMQGAMKHFWPGAPAQQPPPEKQ